MLFQAVVVCANYFGHMSVVVCANCSGHTSELTCQLKAALPSILCFTLLWGFSYCPNNGYEWALKFFPWA